MRNFLPAALFVAAIGFTACSDNTTTIDTPLPENKAAFVNLRLSQTAFDTDTISVIDSAFKTVDDPVYLSFFLSVNAVNLGDAMLSSARCMILAEGTDAVVFATMLTRSGSEDFSDTLSVRIRRGDVGTYRLQITGKDSRGIEVTPVFTTLTVLYGKEAPVVSDLVAADTVDRPASGFILLTLSVACIDKAGRNNIQGVFCNAYKPDGSKSMSNTNMLNDGRNGDLVAGDNIYSTQVQLPASGDPGLYRFEFSAVNYSGCSSNVIIHHILVR